MKRTGVLLIIAMLFMMMAGCSGQSVSTSPQGTGQAVELSISAASSLTAPMDEIKAEYEKANAGVKLVTNYEASGTLQKQIEQGAPCDLFISAGQKQMDALAAANLLDAGSRLNLLGNELVLVVPAANTTIKGFSDLTPDKVKMLAMGDPASVPAGQYGEETLTKLGLLEALKSGNKITYAKNVKEVLAQVEAGNADAGLVYVSDAKGNSKVTLVATAPADSHKAIVYPAALITAGKNKEAAQKFLDYLASPAAQAIFEKYGFIFIGKK